MQFTLKFALLALASIMAGVQVIASPVAAPAAEPEPQGIDAQYWHSATEYTGENCDGDVVADHNGPFVFDVPMNDDKTNSVFLYNGINEWHGFAEHAKPWVDPYENFCKGTAYGRLIEGETGCYNLNSNGHRVRCVGWFSST